MQPQSVITRMKPAFRAFVFAPPARIVYVWASHAGVHTSHLHLCGVSARGPVALQYVCVWLRPITADDSCGAAGRQGDTSVHLCASSCQADQPQTVT